MKDQSDYKLDKCLEKLHEIDLKVVTLQGLIERMETAEKKIDKIEQRMFKMTILFVIVLSSIGAHYGTELLKVLKVLV